MAKRTPMPCTPENCGDAYPKCGRIGTYGGRHKCRCDSCCAVRKADDRQRYEANRDKLIAQVQARYWENREEILQYHRRHRLENLDRINAYQRQYSKDNRKKVAEKTARWRAANPERNAEACRLWRENNPERIKEHMRKAAKAYRARKQDAVTVPFTVDQLRNRINYYGARCYLRLDGCTGGFDHLEHVKPLSKGGAHMLSNLRPACANCNLRKNAKWPFNPESERRPA